MSNAGGEPLAAGAVPETVNIPLTPPRAAWTSTCERSRRSHSVAHVEGKVHATVGDRELEVLGEVGVLTACEVLNACGTKGLTAF